jgi:hypothetical protein
VTIKKGVDTTLAVTLRALVLETFLRLSSVVGSVDPALEPNVVRMHCCELS